MLWQETEVQSYKRRTPSSQPCVLHNVEPGSEEVSSCSIGRQGGSCLPQVPVSWDFGSSMALVVFRAHACLVPSSAAALSPLYWPGLPVSSRLKSSSHSELTVKIGACEHDWNQYWVQIQLLPRDGTHLDVLVLIWEINFYNSRRYCAQIKRYSMAHALALKMNIEIVGTSDLYLVRFVSLNLFNWCSKEETIMK